MFLSSNSRLTPSFKVPLESLIDVCCRMFYQPGSSVGTGLGMDRVEAKLEGQSVADSLQVFPGDVRVAGGSGPRRGATQCQDVGPQRGQPLRAELGVYQVQMCPHHQDGRVRRPCLQINRHTGEGGSQSWQLQASRRKTSGCSDQFFQSDCDHLIMKDPSARWQVTFKG